MCLLFRNTEVLAVCFLRMNFNGVGIGRGAGCERLKQAPAEPGATTRRDGATQRQL